MSDETTSAFLIVEVLEKFRVSLIGADRGSLGLMKIHSVFVLLRLVNLIPLVLRVPGSGFAVSGYCESALRAGEPIEKSMPGYLFFCRGQNCLKVRWFFLPCNNADFNPLESGIL